MPMWFLTKEKKEELCKQRDAKVESLSYSKTPMTNSEAKVWPFNCLAADWTKHPEEEESSRPLEGRSCCILWGARGIDLWTSVWSLIQDSCIYSALKIFSPHYVFALFQSAEAKEKENAAMPVKKGAGKGKTVKVKQETLPTPQGRRVIPRVTSTMKAEANKKADLKKGEGKRGKKIKVCLCSLHHFPILLLSLINDHLTWCNLCNCRVRMWWWRWSLMMQRVSCPARMLAWLHDWARKLKPRQGKKVRLAKTPSQQVATVSEKLPGWCCNLDSEPKAKAALRH